jgi:hypothetical protein
MESSGAAISLQFDNENFHRYESGPSFQFHLRDLFELDYIPELFEALDLNFNYVSLL